MLCMLPSTALWCKFLIYSTGPVILHNTCLIQKKQFFPVPDLWHETVNEQGERKTFSLLPHVLNCWKTATFFSLERFKLNIPGLVAQLLVTAGQAHVGVHHPQVGQCELVWQIWSQQEKVVFNAGHFPGSSGCLVHPDLSWPVATTGGMAGLRLRGRRMNCLQQPHHGENGLEPHILSHSAPPYFFSSDSDNNAEKLKVIPHRQKTRELLQRE